MMRRVISMPRPERTVSKLLAETYRLFCEQDGTIHDALYDVWEASRSGEPVICEAFVALEQASRVVSDDRRMTYVRLEDTEPELIKTMFAQAITITESKTRTKARVA